MIAPNVATRIDHTLKPLTPVPPNTPTMSPPTTAPTIPTRIVTIMPPGSSPGTSSLASKPAMSPTTIQLMMPTYLLPLARSSPLRPNSAISLDHVRHEGVAVIHPLVDLVGGVGH